MASLKQLIENIKAIEQELPNVMRQAAEIMANDGKALAERTIKDKGFGALYNSYELPPWYYEGKELNQIGAKFISEKNEADEGFAWRDLRKEQGLQIDFVDLSYTARMWNGMRPDAVKEEDGKFFCVMGHNDKEGRNKMNWNFERYGDFIGIALEGQEELLQQVAFDHIEQLLEKYL
jgi:hypothetical protein